VVARAGVNLPTDQNVDAVDWTRPPRHALFAYIEHLANALAAAYAAEQEKLDTGVTSEMVRGAARIADAVEQMWVYLSRWYPPGHFGDSAEHYISAFRSYRAKFHWALAQVDGEEPGTMVRPMVVFSVIGDLERNVEATVKALTRFDEGDFLTKWLPRGQRASCDAPRNKSIGWLASFQS
jgi:hypothetical protein